SPLQPSTGQTLRPDSKNSHALPRPSVTFASSNPCSNKPPAGRGAWAVVSRTGPHAKVNPAAKLSQLDNRMSGQRPSSSSTGSTVSSPPQVENIHGNHQHSTNITSVPMVRVRVAAMSTTKVVLHSLNLRSSFDDFLPIL